ncbi:hypothetical protein AADR41_01930 [Streptomyces sp. CLV115]|uniref:hypothetical protein n=1 Tax=Streptomyces sp. CLV115 TaxID=3138502 RepID=UPI00313E7EC4
MNLDNRCDLSGRVAVVTGASRGIGLLQRETSPVHGDFHLLDVITERSTAEVEAVPDRADELIAQSRAVPVKAGIRRREPGTSSHSCRANSRCTDQVIGDTSGTGKQETIPHRRLRGGSGSGGGHRERDSVFDDR